MPSDFERRAIQRLVDQANALGVDVPSEISRLLVDHGRGNNGARLWARANPDADGTGCCWGDVLDGPEGCNCWKPVFNAEQADPVLPAAVEDIGVQKRMCGDCAFRKGSPERSDEWKQEALLSLAEEATPFYCHEDMRRPIRWEHPDGRVVEGSTDDWQPPIVNGLPFRLDGRPGLLCAGWAARAGRAEAGRAEP
jgi:hypothetical protein